MKLPTNAALSLDASASEPRARYNFAELRGVIRLTKWLSIVRSMAPLVRSPIRPVGR